MPSLSNKTSNNSRLIVQADGSATQTTVASALTQTVHSMISLPGGDKRHQCQHTDVRASWWQRYTDYRSFCTNTDCTQHEFHFQVDTDGISVSILMFQPASASASAPPVAHNSKKRIRQQQQQATSAWVSGLPDSQLLRVPALLVWTPAGSLYSQLLCTANQQLTACTEDAPLKASMTLCHGAAAGDKMPAVSSTG
ncbi:TPA: hypothetical protein ACH3X1_001778 [Trebouxia sp. C0004]